MGVKKRNVIDFIAIDKKDNTTILLISDELDWEKPMEHLLLLQEKLNYYMSFIESGEVDKEYPEGKNTNRYKIKILFKFSPVMVEEAEDFLNMVGHKLKSNLYDFGWEVR